MTPREPTPHLTLAGCVLVAFASTSPIRVSLAIGPHSLARSSKRTTGHWQSPLIQQPRGCFFRGEDPFMPMSLHRHPVSGSFNLPIQGTFQLSITLLLRYRSRDMFSLGGMCPPDSREISDPRYSRTSQHPTYIENGTITLYGPSFQTSFSNMCRTKMTVLQHHISPQLLGGFGLGCAGFTRRY